MQKTQKWKEIIIRMDPKNLELLSPAIMSLGADGIEELSDGFKIYFPAENWADGKAVALVRAIRVYFPGFAEQAIECSEIPAENWNESWKESFRTFKVTDRLVICPDWEEYTPSGDERVIVIAPKMAFGTGHHETTQLVLQMIEKYVTKGTRVLDAGTGSGVLAIYAGLLGASPLVAFDTDPVAIDNTLENFTLNKITAPHQIFAGSIDQVDGQFNIILANIERNILLELAPDLTNRIVAGGVVILSGLLHTDRELILERYAGYGWTLLDHKQKNEWITLVLKYEPAG